MYKDPLSWILSEKSGFRKINRIPKIKSIFLDIQDKILDNKLIDKSTKDQLRRASLSIVLNIAEGTSRFSKADRRNFYVVSRGSAYEVAAILDILRSEILAPARLLEYKSTLEEISKMLFAMIRQLENK